MQPDTVVPEPGDPQGLNRFAYVRNNPLRYTDPTGHVLEGGTTRDEPYPADEQQAEAALPAVPTYEPEEWGDNYQAWLDYNVAVLSAKYLSGAPLSEEEALLLLTCLAEGGYNKYNIDPTPIYMAQIPSGPPAAIGIRGEISLSLADLGLDFNVELLWRPPSEYGPGQIGLFITPGVGHNPGLPGQLGASVGVVAIPGISDLANYAGPGITVGGSHKLGPGIEVDQTTPLGSSSYRAYYIGFGTGVEMGPYGYLAQTARLALW